MSLMIRQVGYTFAFLIVFSVAGFSQQPTETPLSAVKKANERPTPTPALLAEPFEKSDIQMMASKCVTLDTDAGAITIELFPESAPETVRNFLNLASLGFYDTTTFSRVVPGFVIQGGNIWTRDGGVTATIGNRARRGDTR